MARYRDMFITDSGLIIPSYVKERTLGGPQGYQTRLDVVTTMPAIAGGASLSVGKLLWTYPAGVIYHRGAAMSLALKQSQGNVTADTPDGGLGSTIAAGANALVSDTAGAENFLTGQTFNDCNGTVENKAVDTAVVIEAADAHLGYFNLADGWAASGDAALILRGTVWLFWQKLMDAR